MFPCLRLISLAVAFLAALCACRKPAPHAPVPVAEKHAAGPAEAPAAPAAAGLDQNLTQARDSIKAGSYDEAAAELLRMRMSGAEFSARDAAQYRQTLSEAYSRALEAAAKGDPKAQAAVKMLRATGGH